VKNLHVMVIVAFLVWPCSGESVDLFNGEDLRGWDGDPSIWRVEDGAIIGSVEEGAQVDDHTYLIWQGGQVENFELSLKFRSDAGNSGIDYRAREVAKGRNSKRLRWTIRGYQADIVQNWMGSLYNWGLAGAQPGQFVVVTTAPGGEEEQQVRVFPLADANAVLGAPYYKPDQWNDYTITARGEHVIHRINGFQTIEWIDVSRLKRSEGYLGLQVHAGSKRQVHRFKEIHLKHLPHSFGRPVLLCKVLNSRTLGAIEPDDARLTDRSDLAFEVYGPLGSMTQTEERFSDFILRFQYRRDANDLSIWLRANEDRSIGVTGMGRGSGRIDHKGDFGLRVIEVDKVNREDMPHVDACWDDCEISLIGDELEVKINGRLRAKAVDCDHARGTIGLTSNRTKIVRNMVLVPVIP
jgi:hypothetical protein